MSIVRLYKKDDDGALSFREAWIDAPEPEDADGADDIDARDADDDGVWFVVNHGPVGFQSSTKENKVADVAEAEALLAAFHDQCVTDGFAEVPLAEQSWVVAQFALKNSAAGERDKYLERKASEAITSYFAWRGIGVVDRTEIVAGGHGTGKLNIYTLSPDAAKAVAGIKIAIREAKQDFTKLSIGVAPYDDLSAIKAKHQPKPGAFSL
ncbi:hypothetical protein [Arthrobacter sp. 35W]|uniref:hypothetical protein n=1 Tax=Arthrobacter sp. 35W TaxID=1132441 RepID=UPI00040EF0C6|nr:hypothetical protein [Arthrobacter sp. 35W]